MLDIADTLGREAFLDSLSSRFATCALESIKTVPPCSSQVIFAFSHRRQKGCLSSYSSRIISDLAPEDDTIQKCRRV